MNLCEIESSCNFLGVTEFGCKKSLLGQLGYNSVTMRRSTVSDRHDAPTQWSVLIIFTAHLRGFRAFAPEVVTSKRCHVASGGRFKVNEWDLLTAN